MVLGAGGVVGQVATQAAKLLGARRVVAACRSGGAQERARSAGADAVVVLRGDDTADQLAARMADACDGPVDVVIDPLCGLPASAALRVLGPDGRLVNLGGSAGETATFASAGLRSKAAAILGYTNNAVTTELKAQALADLLGHAASGRLTVSHECVTLDDLPAAWTRQASGEAENRLVVTLD
jgi:NADPH:quinone reductase-like Zn-dependent oxidoreductase